MRAPRFLVLLALMLVLAACGGGDDGSDTTTGDTSAAGSDTTVGGTDTTTTATSPDDADQPVVSSLDDIPQECVDAFVDYLRAIEPTVEGIDFDTATSNDLDQLFTDLEPIEEEFDASTLDLACPDLDDDVDVFPALIEIASREAPGTVGFLEVIASLVGAAGGAAVEASGDCETDIAAVQAYVDQGGTMGDLPMADFAPLLALLTSLSTVCSAERSAEFFSQDDVTAFMSE